MSFRTKFSSNQPDILVPSASRTASGSLVIDSWPGQWDDIALWLVVGTVTGTTPTLDVKYEVSPDKGTTWVDFPSGAFTQVTASNAKERLAFAPHCGVYGRISWTIGGTTPDFTFAVYGEGKRRG